MRPAQGQPEHRPRERLFTYLTILGAVACVAAVFQLTEGDRSGFNGLGAGLAVIAISEWCRWRFGER